MQIEERLYVANDLDEAKSLMIPDLHIREVQGFPSSAAQIGGTAVAPGLEPDHWEVEVTEARLAVIDRESRRVVTVIEILSPANKAKGSVGHTSYEEKKREVLSPQTHLVEIDLLRAGTPLIRNPMFPPHDYLSQVWRWPGEGRHRRWAWPMQMTEPLPTIPIPLALGEPESSLDLQQALNTAYARAGYELRVDYSAEPVPPLTPEQTQWAKGVVAGQSEPLA